MQFKEMKNDIEVYNKNKFVKKNSNIKRENIMLKING